MDLLHRLLYLLGDNYFLISRVSTRISVFYVAVLSVAFLTYTVS